MKLALYYVLHKDQADGCSDAKPGLRAPPFACQLRTFRPGGRAVCRISVEGVDGVAFGDTPEEVIDKLGLYDGWSIADGLGRAWHVYRYESGQQAGLWIYLMEVPGVDERGDSTLVAGPVDFFSMRYPYNGQTSKGIGVGSTREAVRKAYGEPIAVGRSERLFYCLGQKNLEVVILADTVGSLHLKYFKPLKGYDYCSR